MKARTVDAAVKLDTALGDLRHDLAAAAAVLQAALITRSDSDVRVLLTIGSGAVGRAMDMLSALRDLLEVKS